VREKIEAVIAESIRPLIEADGGQIDLVSIEGDTIVIRLAGMCAGCPGSSYTTSRIIEPILKKALGGSITVRVEVGPG
jgi:NifU-like protein